MDAGQIAVQMAATPAAASVAKDATGASSNADSGMFAGVLGTMTAATGGKQDTDPKGQVDKPVDGEPGKTVEDAQLAAVLQNVALSLVGAQLAAQQLVDGRMPEAAQQAVQADVPVAVAGASSIAETVAGGQPEPVSSMVVALPAQLLEAMPVSTMTTDTAMMSETPKAIVPEAPKAAQEQAALAKVMTADLQATAAQVAVTTAQLAEDGQGAVQTQEAQPRQSATKNVSQAPPVAVDPRLNVAQAVEIASGGTDVVSPSVTPSREPVRAAGFTFARSASMEAVVGNAVQANGQVVEKQPLVTDATKVGSLGQSLEKIAGERTLSDGSQQGADGEALKQQAQEAPRPVLQATAPPQTSFTVTPPSTVTVASAVSETGIIPGGHVAGQVREQLVNHDIKPGSEELTIRLSPDHLGDIRVNFRMEDQRLKVEIVAENKTARESLLQHADALKESLSRQNITMEKFDVTSGGSNSGSPGSNPQGEWRELVKNRQMQQWMTASGGYRTSAQTPLTAAPSYIARSEHSVVDLHF